MHKLREYTKTEIYSHYILNVNICFIILKVETLYNIVLCTRIVPI